MMRRDEVVGYFVMKAYVMRELRGRRPRSSFLAMSIDTLKITFFV
jgi:hypothetical protein